MLLSSLVGADVTAPPGSGSIEIAGLTADSRLVRPGYLFVAVAGTRADGARFIADAVTKGAAAVLTGSATDVVSQPVPVLRADEPRPSLQRDEVLRAAPAVEDGRFRVPPILGAAP